MASDLLTDTDLSQEDRTDEMENSLRMLNERLEALEERVELTWRRIDAISERMEDDGK